MARHRQGRGGADAWYGDADQQANAKQILGIPTDLFTPIFAIARTSGWTAHVLEQLADNRLIRPQSVYTGPVGLKVVPVDQR